MVSSIIVGLVDTMKSSIKHRFKRYLRATMPSLQLLYYPSLGSMGRWLTEENSVKASANSEN